MGDDILARVRRLDRAAVEQILTSSYPSVHRMAHALAGTPAAGARVARRVLRQGLRVMPGWRKGIIPENWFYHHTLLTARELSPHPPAQSSDVLLLAGPPDDPAYAAFVRGLRGLGRQQMEAFVLHHGERLNARLLGVAMDSSTGAAANHLSAADDAMRTLAGADFGDRVARLSAAYAALTPPETAVRGTARREAASAIWARRVRRLIRRLFILALLAGLAYAGWRWRDLLLQWYHAARDHAQTRPA